MTDTRILRRAMVISRHMHDNYVSWLEDCERDRRNGHRARYCEHGTDQWTDYDNICGWCEDGISAEDSVKRRRYALDQAHSEWSDVEKQRTECDTFAQLIREHGDNDPESFPFYRVAKDHLEYLESRFIASC